MPRFACSAFTINVLVFLRLSFLRAHCNAFYLKSLCCRALFKNRLLVELSFSFSYYFSFIFLFFSLTFCFQKLLHILNIFLSCLLFTKFYKIKFTLFGDSLSCGCQQTLANFSKLFFLSQLSFNFLCFLHINIIIGEC